MNLLMAVAFTWILLIRSDEKDDRTLVKQYPAARSIDLKPLPWKVRSESCYFGHSSMTRPDQ